MTHRILSLDTTSDRGSLALVLGGRVVAAADLRPSGGYGHVLFPEIEALLGGSGWRLGDVDCFAGAAGPGSFTGIRVGLAAVKGLAAALGKPAVAVSSLQAIAWHGAAPLRAAVLDARRGEVYGAVYTASLEIQQAETATGLAEWIRALPAGEIEVLTTDLAWLSAGLARSGLQAPPAREVTGALAGAVGLIAAGRLSRAGAPDPAAVDANYVRRSDAELFWREW